MPIWDGLFHLALCCELSRGWLCWWNGPWCRGVLHQEHYPISLVIYWVYTFKKDWNESERDVARDLGVWGCRSLCDDTWCHVVPLWSPTPWSHFQSPPTPRGSNMFFFLFACEGVLNRGPASHSRKQQGWDAPWDPWNSGPSQTSPILRALLRLCISFASEAP